MSKTVSAAIAVVLFGGLALGSAQGPSGPLGPPPPPPTGVQDPVEVAMARNVPFLECQGAEVRDLLRRIFRGNSMEYTLAPDIQGVVTLNLRDVRFDILLETVLRQVDATYRVEGGVVQVIRRVGEGVTTRVPDDDLLVRIVPSVEFQSADVRHALRQLFRNQGVSYTVAPDVQGTVTLSLTNVTFETALTNLTRQVDATYRIEGGVILIVKRPSDGPRLGDFEPIPIVPSAPPSLSLDRQFLYIVQYDHIFKLRKSDLREADQGRLEVSVTDGKGQPMSPAKWIQWSQRKVDVAYARKPIREVIQQLAALGNAAARMDSDVSGEVTLQRKGITVAEALEEATKQVGARYRRDAGRLHIYKPALPIGGAAGSPFQPPAPDEPATTAQDGEYLYVVRGHRVDKVRKRDLEVVAVGYLLLKPKPTSAERGG
ncbi:MAG: hypothetical protein ACO1SV_03405 [Fimbriimonas sp.]